jgi:hypothetical protein
VSDDAGFLDDDVFLRTGVRVVVPAHRRFVRADAQLGLVLEDPFIVNVIDEPVAGGVAGHRPGLPGEQTSEIERLQDGARVVEDLGGVVDELHDP